MFLEKMLANPRLIRAVTSLDRSELERWVFAFEGEWIKARRRGLTKRGTERIRALGAGRRGQLESIRHKLVFILMYFKLYPLQEVMGLLFGFNQWEANRWVHRLTPVLEKALGRRMELPARRLSGLGAGARGVSEPGICAGRGGASGAPTEGQRPAKEELQREKEAAQRQESGRHFPRQDQGIEPDGSRQCA